MRRLFIAVVLILGDLAQAQPSCANIYLGEARSSSSEAKLFGGVSFAIGSAAATYGFFKKGEAFALPIIFAGVGTPVFLADAFIAWEQSSNKKRFGKAILEAQQGKPDRALQTLTVFVNTAIAKRAYLETPQLSKSLLIRDFSDWKYYRDQPFTSQKVAGALSALDTSESLCPGGRSLDFDSFLRLVIKQLL